MNSNEGIIRFAFALILCVFVALAPALATPRWTPEHIAADFSQISGAPAREPVVTHRERPSTLDEVEYFRHFRMLCDFLVTMQYSQAGADFGGMIEGQGPPDNSIIQTDNTQEAIREWSQYAIWTGDTARYAPNIRAAWTYATRNPAWREEGGGYYAAHNCGWGLEAVLNFRTAYSDTSKNWYADSCSLWLFQNPLAFNPNSTDLGQLEPLAEGLGIGGMYAHTLYRNRTDWQTFTIQQARRLRQWFQSNPARLNANETWALCGGTALWGLCSSLFTQYPDSGRDWINQYGPQLDIWQSVGEWNHSYNAWYCNAQYACFELTQDSTYWQNAIFITDSLIGLDLDQDGGIPPGRNFPQTNDHSWVSSYMGWMGMEHVINVTTVTDLAMVHFQSPNPSLPYLAGDTLVVSLRVANNSRTTLTGHVSVTGNFTDTMNVTLPAGQENTFTFSHRWVRPDNDNLPAVSYLFATISCPNDNISWNDTLTAGFYIRHGVDITGAIWGDDHSTPVGAHVEFFHEAYPDSAWAVEDNPGNSVYTNGPRKLMEGQNRIVVTPALNYLPTEATLNLVPGPVPTQHDFQLLSTQVLLVDDDVNQHYENFYLSSLDSFALNVRVLNRANSGTVNLEDIPTVIWFTGDDSATSLTVSDQTQLASYLSSGGNLLLTGQNIADNTQLTSAFLDTVLHCSLRTANTNTRRVLGIAGSPISNGLELALIGSQGANNQVSPASLNELPGSTPIFRYVNADSQVCGVAGVHQDGHYVFLSFGLEAASGVGNTTRRNTVLARCFAWFNDSLSALNDPPTLQPQQIWLAQNYPNPFNPSTAIRFHLPKGSDLATLAIYNVLGQRIRTLYQHEGTGNEVELIWDGRTDGNLPATSGFYIYQLHSGSTRITKSLQLLR